MTLLATGSLTILVSWILAVSSRGSGLLWINFAIVLVWIGAFLHLVAWGHLAASLRSRSPAQGIFALTILALTVGILTLPYALPYQGWFPPWLFLLLSGFFVLVPSIYGPVVALHGTIFMLTSDDLPSEIRGLTAKLAAVSLMVLGSYTLLMQVLNPSLLEPLLTAPFLSFAGLTGFLYLALRLAWGRGDLEEREERLRGVSW